MSESSPQLAQLLLPAASLTGLPGQPGAAVSGGRGDSSATRIDTGFQRQLQALLNGAEPDSETVLPIGSEPLLATRVAQQPGDLIDAAPLPPQTKEMSRSQQAAADGKLLPEGGNILPLPLAASGAVLAPEAPSGAELNARIADVTAAPLNNGRAELAQQLGLRAVGGNEANSAVGAGEQADAGAEQRPVAVSADGRDGGLRTATQVATNQPVLPATANPVADIMRRAQAFDGTRERLPASGIDARLAELGNPTAQRDGVARVTAATDSAAAQFNLHARPEGLLQPGALTPEAALRDLAAMTPLRPQTGESAAKWSAGLGQRLLMMAENGIETARLRLNPASLGPLDIQVNVEDDQARVWFGAQNSATRDALEAALPRLRELFAEQGLQLAEADVGERGADGTPADPDTGDNRTGVAAAAAQAVGDGDVAGPRIWGDSGGGGLDIYV